MDDFREFTTPVGPIVIRRTAVAGVRPWPTDAEQVWDNFEVKSIIHFNGSGWEVAEEYEDVRDWAFPKNAQD